MSKTISFHNGTVWSRGHNIRDERYTSKQEHIDSSLTANNVTICDIPVRKAYEDIFGQAVKEYNDNQTRKDRKIDCYYDKIKKDKRKHPVYECIVQIGDKDDTGNSAKLEKQALIRFAKESDKRNPNLYLIGAYIHADEPHGTVHLHCDYIPVAECSRGMCIQNSYDKALQQQGFKSLNIHQTAQIEWQTCEREALTLICKELKIDAEHSQGIGKGREYLTPQEYKRAKDKMNAEIQAELQPLKQELQEYTNIQRDFQNITVQTKKIPFTQNVVVATSELKEIENQAKSYRAVRSQISTLEERKQQLVEKELELQSKELKLTEREKNCKKIEMSFEHLNYSLEQAKNEVKIYSKKLSDEQSKSSDYYLKLEYTKDELYELEKRYDSLIKIAQKDCFLIKDFTLAVKMLLFSENSPYKANLTEEQTVLIKSLINITKELLQKRNMPQSVNDIETKCEIAPLILKEIEKLTPPKNQPLFSIEKIKSDEFKPTSEVNSHIKPTYRSR